MSESVEELKARIDELEKLVKPYYTPPAGPEYSFPTERMGITQDQFRLMHLGQANGMIHGDNGVINDSPNSTGWRYYLDKHDSDAVTNERNTLILRAGTSAESIVEGFYHRLTEDMELSFPPVTTRTIYHVCITYDPRKFKDPNGPLSVEVYPGEPPTTEGRIHLLLHTVDRRPNQLLTQAIRTRYRPYTAGLLSVQNRNQLPDPKEYPAGTVVVPSANGHGIYVRQNGGHVWLDPISHKADKPDSWKSMNLSTNALGVSGPAYYRRVPAAGGVQLYLHLQAERSPSGSYIVSFPTSSGISFRRSWYNTFAGSGAAGGNIYHSTSYNSRGILANGNSRYIRFSGIIPDYVLSGV